VAGEKMPWLTFHIALPMILLTGWGLGQVIERLNWHNFRKQHGGLITIMFIVLFISLSWALIMALGPHPPFQGKMLEQLFATGTFLLLVVVALASTGGLLYISSSWSNRDVLRIAVLSFFALLGILTVRTGVRSTFIHPNDATEYLVYAHGATGIKDVMDQINMISECLAGEKNLKVAYDNNLPNQGVSWSFKWYLRDYPNAISYDKPSGSLRDFPIIIVDQQNFDNIKPIVGNSYYRIDYIRMVWPNQDYFAITWARIKNVLLNPVLRDAIFQIWLNRDYSEYARATGGSGLSLSDWQPSARMQLLIRKDIAAQIWEYGIFQVKPLQADPYEKGATSLAADLVFGSGGNLPGQFNSPRGLSVAPDGSLYVADSRNNRIQHFNAKGDLLLAFGNTSPGCPYATTPPNNVPTGTFCEPWDVAISPGGQWIYVADTWNHRIQKFSADGVPVMAWGIPNYDPVSSDPYGLWGPRGIAVDSQGHVLVVDTGNKRIVIYDENGNFISQFGGAGANAGQFDEPVGLGLDAQGNLYVADTWNHRIQVFVPNADKTIYTASFQWDIAGWSSESLDNKPYLAVDQNQHIFATDPDAFRIIEFTTSGEFVRTWGKYGNGPEDFSSTSGICVDNQGRVWVSDAAQNRLMQFTMPGSIVPLQ
jgi:DNA-binding beta-propeller fold protein YncE